MNAILEPEISQANRTLTDIVQAATRRIPPLWSLKHFVAVNPFVGLADRHFIAAARLMRQVGPGEMLMPASFYREQIAHGRIQESSLQTALALAEKTLPPEWAEELRFGTLDALKAALADADVPAPEHAFTFADFVDARHPTGWAAFVVDEISKWCSAYYDEGQASWRMPWRGQGLFSAWQAAARLDVNPELMGLEKFRAFVATLPDDPLELIEKALGQLGVPAPVQTDFLHRQLMSVAGWSSYVQCLVRAKNMAGETDDSLAQLLAIRLAFDLALQAQFAPKTSPNGEWQQQLAAMERDGGQIATDLLARFVAQQALECAGQNDLIAKLKNHPAQPVAPGPKALQAIFCIDVRSEVFRRALEAQSDQIETVGFAGFFGMAIEYQRFGQTGGSAQCPVLLTPKFKVREALRRADDEAALRRRMDFRQTVNGAWNAFKTSAISCFSFVETAGLWFGVKLAKDSLALAGAESAFAAGGRRRSFAPKIERESCCGGSFGHAPETGFAPADQIALAAGALKNMGLVSNFAKVVLICGHGSATTNNPYASALDCGACGGHAGDANARVAATILNQPAVRAGLKLRGMEIPEETVFLAGLHNTTTDEILIYEDEPLTPDQEMELSKIKGWLAATSRQARRERAASLGLADVEDDQLDAAVEVRSRDWSQVRPEWGLAGNAAFIAAPRERTRGLNLDGRVFLHDYHAPRDPDRSTLELILCAPMVVASWINLQYYGSTVDNRRFGSGNKVLHNVVGTFGVWQGNGGDLQPGLPLQSLHDGARWRHEPLRLSVFIEAPREDIAAIVANQPAVRELVENGWIHLFAMEAAGRNIYRWVGDRFSETSV